MATIKARNVATVAFLGVVAGVQMSDRGLYALLAGRIEEAFRVGDTMIGALQGVAGILIASALSIPAGRLADRHSRKAILLGLVLAWSALTALAALAPTFPLFFLGRAASGITEFAMIPIVYSLIPDLVPDRWRVAANLGFAALMALGASAGFYYAEALASLAAAWRPLGLAEWRGALLLLSLCGLPLLLIGFGTVDPARQRSARTADAGVATLLTFVRARRRTVLLFLGAAGGLAVAVQATTPMAVLALSRRFHAELGLIGHALGLITLVTSLASLPVAGLGDHVLRTRFGADARPLVMAIGAAAAVPFLLLLWGAASEGPALAALGCFVLLTCIANALLPTALQDLASPELRARSFAAYSFIIAGFCALGPVLSGAVSQYVTGDDLLAAIPLVAVPALIAAAWCALKLRTTQVAGVGHALSASG